jgi:hypothetical protein
MKHFHHPALLALFIFLSVLSLGVALLFPTLASLLFRETPLLSPLLEFWGLLLLMSL